MKYNLHTHSTFCDGADAPEAVVEAALAKGFAALGFSSHSDMVKDLGAYKAEIRRLRDKYAGRIRILCGIEAEYDTGFPRGDFDYVIGSAHYITAPDGARFAFDHSVKILSDGVRDHFGGSAEAFVRAFFAQERKLAAEYDCDIIGHLDLVRKFNAKHPFFVRISCGSRGWRLSYSARIKGASARCSLRSSRAASSVMRQTRKTIRPSTNENTPATLNEETLV